MRWSLSVIGIAAGMICSACGGKATLDSSDHDTLGGEDTATQGNALDACTASPMRRVEYESVEELNAELVGRWRRCGTPQARGEDVGVEFSADGRWHALTTDSSGNVVRRSGFGGAWSYKPKGSLNPISGQPSQRAFLELDGVITDPPQLSAEPSQLRILFTPVQSKYVRIPS
jgi:hypothetical protein